uniref:Retrovirus-related Pol polyprotein from transposon TNT 1-94 n=1 Tax=Tanacetum cinerariifolium TaxID=118510 RepID=A0A699HAB7_TANCI|nr:retrovirus-related Pol polyprotein from transposon TNT 1-94 [Tanacetum cinerariifolium]
MLFYLTSLHVSYVLTNSEPVDLYIVDGQNVPTKAQMADYERAASQLNHNEYNCINYILNALDDSISRRIRVEEDNMMNEKADANSIEPNANMVGESSSKSKSKHKNKGKNGGSGQKYSRMKRKITPNKRTKTSRKFITVGSVENLGIKLKIVATRKNMEAKIMEEIPTKQTMWSATKQICNSRRMFVSYQKLNESEPMFMGNETALKIERKGKVILKLTSGKDLVLSNVLHVPNITKNLISGPILRNKGFKLVFESDKFVITKSGMCVGKGYLDEGLFKLSVVTDDNVINNNNTGTSTASVYMIDPSFLWHSRLGHSTASVYMIDPSFLWHSRLGHVNFCFLQRMINLGMLPKCSKDKISTAPHSLWGEACLAANTILNKISHKNSDKSPYHLWKGKQPFYKRMKVWGCLVKVQIPLPKRTKLGPKTVDCVYLGPAKNSVAYRFLVYKSNVEDISNNTIIESAKPDFFENIFPYKDKEKQISNLRKRVMNYQLSQDETDYNSKAAMESSESPYWKEAIQSEIDSIVQNNTWKLVDLPSRHKPIGHKWIFKKKLRPDGTIEKYKARLVAKGYRQKEDEEIYMKQPDGFVVKDDMLIMGTNMDVINQTKKMLHSSFDMKDMGEADVILVLEGYCDANWIFNHNEGKYTSGYVFTLGGAAVSWKSSKQTVNTRSTMEAEFVALEKATEEAE